MTLELLLSIAIVFSLIVGAVFLGYVIAIVIPFLRYRPRATGDANDYVWHFVIPCRDEEAVIGETIDYLRRHFAEANIWVVDDDSEDSTAKIVSEHASRSPLVHLIQRRRPHARQGKAHALNFAWHRLLGALGPSADLTRSILIVVDADGRPSANLLDVAAAAHLFGSDDIAAVQVEVRMSNRDVRTPLPGKGRIANLAARTFVRMQDLEFRGPISAIQLSRRFSRTVNLGGNGQLARMSALADIAGEDGPWKGALLEDFELGLHLLLEGWRNAYTPDAWVDQEALFNVRRYLTQRARWAQGTMQCMRYLGRVWLMPRLTNLGALEVTYFLFQPWIQLLGTVLYPIPLLAFVYNSIVAPSVVMHFMSNGGAILFAAYAVIGLGEFVIWGYIYRRRSEPTAGVLTATGWGFAYLLYIYLVYIIAWKSFLQLLRRQTAWAKTIRNAEAIPADKLVARLK